VLVFTGLMIGNTMAGLDATIVATTGQTIVADLGSQKLLPWVFTAYQLAQIAAMPLYGKLGDLFGRKRVFATAILLFVAGSMLCGAAPTMAVFLLARALQGLGAGGLTGLSMAIVADITPPAKLGSYLGYTGFVFAVTSVLGPLMGGLFVDHLSWRWAFYINLPSAVIALVALYFVPRIVPGGSSRRIDLLGTALMAVTVTTGVLAVSWGGVQYEWSSPLIISLIAVACISLAAFVMWEQRAPEPLIPGRVFAARQVGISVFANLVAGIAFFGVIVYLPVWFQSVSGRSATQSGLLLVPSALATALGTTIVGHVVPRTGGAKAFPVAGMAAMATGFALLSRSATDTALVVIIVESVLVGLGVGFVMQVLLYVVQRSVRPADLGAATAVTVLARILGGVVGVAVLGNVFNHNLTHQLAQRAAALDPSKVHGDPASIAALPALLRTEVVASYAHALTMTFRATVPVMLVGLLVTARLPVREVRERLRAGDEVAVTEPAVV
jgi:EmrB/QacA subfamily drug resistance transporter